MPWKERTVNQMREEFVLRVLSREKSKAELCREYGISRPTGDKWIERYLNGEGLDDQNRRPHRIERTPPEIEGKIVDLRKQHPAIGAAKMRQILINRGETEIPCAKTINNILKRNGLITEAASKAATHYRRFMRDAPNQMWQTAYETADRVITENDHALVTADQVITTDGGYTYSAYQQLFMGDNQRPEIIKESILQIYQDAHTWRSGSWIWVFSYCMEGRCIPRRRGRRSGSINP